MNNMLRILPLLVMLLLSFLISMGLFNKDKNNPIDNRHNGQKFTNFEVPSLAKDTIFSPKLFGNGQVIVVNVFASWCKPCLAEHALLMKLAHKVNIYGVAWKDKAEPVMRYLQAQGNPFQQIAIDESGITTIPMMLTGVPETFVLNKRGEIVLHYREVITEDLLKNLIFPLIEQLNRENEPAN